MNTSINCAIGNCLQIPVWRCRKTLRQHDKYPHACGCFKPAAFNQLGGRPGIWHLDGGGGAQRVDASTLFLLCVLPEPWFPKKQKDTAEKDLCTGITNILDPMDHQAPLFLGFPRQEYWSGLPFPSPGDLPDPGIEPMSLRLLHSQMDSLPLSNQESSTKPKCKS